MNNQSQSRAMKIAGKPAATVVRPRGEINYETAPELRSDLMTLADRRPARVVIDLSGVTHLDSAGLGTLVEFRRRAESWGGKLVLAGLRPEIRGVFEVTKLDAFFATVPTADDAFAGKRLPRQARSNRRVS